MYMRIMNEKEIQIALQVNLKCTLLNIIIFIFIYALKILSQE